MMNSSSNPYPNLIPMFNDRMWVIQIRSCLDEKPDDEDEAPVNIFKVPRALMANKPECYAPQEVALGPFHCLRPELYEMQRYKIAAAKRAQRNLRCETFQNLVDELAGHEVRIRACYHKFLQCHGDALAWMMAIDACFLLEFLQVYAGCDGRAMMGCSGSSRMMSHLVDYAGTKAAHNAILRDVLMVENQIPLFLLRRVLEFELPNVGQADDVLRSMLAGLGEHVCPFTVGEAEWDEKIDVEEEAHLVDFLYHLIVPRSKHDVGTISEEAEADEEDEMSPNEIKSEEPPAKEGNTASTISYVQQLSSALWDLLSTSTQGPLSLLNRRLRSGPGKFILNLPWSKISALPLFSIFSADKSAGSEGGNSISSSKFGGSICQSPLMEEIAIPSVSELSKAGIRFVPTYGSISSIAFDAKKATLYLPTISLDVNTEVILRNLVAYESSWASGPMVVTRYAELMNGIIDTEEDARILRERGIIRNRLKSDEEVASMWNGMSRAIRLTRVPALDKVIEDVNRHHSGVWKVKAGKLMKSYVFGSWRCLIFLATVLILLLMILQSFCTVYSCSRLFGWPN